jgi:hypothetical protein
MASPAPATSSACRWAVRAGRLRPLPGRRNLAARAPAPNAWTITFPIDRVRALVVTHVHIDHVGRIPYLLAAGYRGPIVCSQASAALLPLVLEDALKVGFTRDQALIERFLAQIRQQTIAVPYKQWHTSSPASRRCASSSRRPATSSARPTSNLNCAGR